MIKYFILQLPINNPAKFMDLDFVKKNCGIPERGDYVRVYDGKTIDHRDTETILNAIWEELNINHPADYHAHSLSVSDVVGLYNGGWHWYYVDSIGFKEVWR